jgi:hypothetical protein
MGRTACASMLKESSRTAGVTPSDAGDNGGPKDHARALSSCTGVKIRNHPPLGYSTTRSQATHTSAMASEALPTRSPGANEIRPAVCRPPVHRAAGADKIRASPSICAATL